MTIPIELKMFPCPEKKKNSHFRCNGGRSGICDHKNGNYHRAGGLKYSILFLINFSVHFFFGSLFAPGTRNSTVHALSLDSLERSRIRLCPQRISALSDGKIQMCACKAHSSPSGRRFLIISDKKFSLFLVVFPTVDPSLFPDPRRAHLTLFMLKIFNPSALKQAVFLLKSTCEEFRKVWSFFWE